MNQFSTSDATRLKGDNQSGIMNSHQPVVAETPGLITLMVNSLKDIMRIQGETAETIHKLRESVMGPYPKEEEKPVNEVAHTLLAIRDTLPELVEEAIKQREGLQSLLNTLEG